MHFNEIEYSRVIDFFPNYVISSFGRVFNRTTGREMWLSPTTHGDLTVGLVRDGVQYRRSVKCLVAKAFVKGETEIFNTPIQLDGRKENLSAHNIRWRPRSFAWEYSRQFTDTRAFFYYGPIYDIVNDLHYETIFDASIANGSLCKDIRAAIPSGTHVFPTGEKYVYI